MDNYFFEYKAELYLNNEVHIELGVTHASNYTDAMSNIESYYGDELIRITLYPTVHDGIYILDGPGREEFFDGRD